jgi:hypothetical protein
MNTRFVLLALVAGALGCDAAVEPGFAPSPAPPAGAAALVATATLGAPGHADVVIEGRALGPLFGLSFHVTATNAALDEVKAGDALALDRTVARIDGNDVALGGTRLDPQSGDVALEEGALASFHVTAVEAGDVELRIERAVVRRADGSFMPVAVAGGTLTLEAAQ